MVIRLSGFLGAALLFFLQIIPAWADDAVNFSETETNIVHRLVWPQTAHTLHYEVIIETEKENIYRALIRKFTDDCFVEISLPPGKYRYGVIPYDMLNRPGPAPDWVAFEVFQALKPEIHEFSPSSFTVKRDAAFELNISGTNLLDGAQLYLYNLNSESIPIIPNEVFFLDEGNRVRLVFYNEALIPGIYGIFVKNPGGYETTAEEIAIARNMNLWKPDEFNPLSSRVDLFLGIAWTPIFRTHGNAEDFFAQTPLGLELRIGAVNSDIKPVNLGLEFCTDWHYFPRKAEFEGNMLLFQMDMLLQKRFPAQGAAFTLRAGGGYSFLTGKTLAQYLVRRLDEQCPFLNVCVSFIWLGHKRFFLEAGIDYAYFFSNNTASGFLYRYFLRPWFGFGLRF
ncbi:MAG: hypothetical protein LBH43_21720 [Treponema sp.]|jgi:hypothetical protein|nr:hypothetical protein [Treponema sp.]